jgi:UDP-glucose 4-epimerase
MTRFLMSLDESVDLVLYAFQHAQPGDIFVQKAPASTVGDLAQTLREMLGRDNEIRVIGTRHGEKLYESLVSREEMARAEDLGGYFRIPADSRDLNYDKYFVQGETRISQLEDYTSHNTERLDVAGIKRVLSGLDVVQEALDA